MNTLKTTSKGNIQDDVSEPEVDDEPIVGQEILTIVLVMVMR